MRQQNVLTQLWSCRYVNKIRRDRFDTTYQCWPGVTVQSGRWW